MKMQRVFDISARPMAAAATAALALCYSTAAISQISDEAVLSIMRECAKIDDPTARLNCYDSNIRAGGSTNQRPIVPGATGKVSGSSAPIVGQASSQGFGAESVKRTDRFKSVEEAGRGVDEIRTRILAVRQREPGIYLVAIEDGGEWIFTQSVPSTFRPPRKGALVEIRRASLGSFLMVVDGQAAVRVRRVN